MPSFAEEEFQAHISFIEAAFDANLPAITAPPAPIGSLGPAGALAGRSYRAIIARFDPLDERIPAVAGVYYLTTDYDVAMADLDYHVNDVSATNVLRVGDLIRIGSFVDPLVGTTRGVYRVRLTNTGGVGAGDPSDEPDSVVTITMKRVDPNLR